MEALAAVSLAGNILQFVDFTSNVITATRQMSASNPTAEYDELESIAQQLQSQSSLIVFRKEKDGSPLSPADKSLKTLTEQCAVVTQDLLDMLNGLKAGGKLSAFRSLKLAVRREWKKEEIDKLQQRIDRLGHGITMHLNHESRESVRTRLGALYEQNLRLDAHRTKEINELTYTLHQLLTDKKKELNDEKLRGEMSRQLLRFVAEGMRYSTEQIVLEQLRFDSMNDRQADIRPAYKQTFSWVFETETMPDAENFSRRTPATFSSWVSSEDNFYWISGKPGSGKSTMMRYLSFHDLTRNELETWCKGGKIIRANFFFWSLGKRQLQRSKEGLLRSLLSQVLRQCPDLIEAAYPHVWLAYGPEGNRNTEARDEAMVPVTFQSLFDTLKDTCTRIAASGGYVCFFIDGLDEHEGPTGDIIDIVNKIRSIGNIKLCVSSRPWNEFEAAFGQDRTRSLYMEDFNKEDIVTYVKGNFEQDQFFQDMEDKDTGGAALMQEIVDAAQGVFLWVVLVVKSFREGLLNGDSLVDLKRRLATLPSDLYEYFERILLADVPEFYHRRAAQMFDVTLNAIDNLPLMIYWFLGEEQPKYALDAEVHPLKLQVTGKRLKDAKRRLTASCRGLIEATQSPSRQLEEALPSSILFNWRVDFLHRSVRDFLNKVGTRTILGSWNQGNPDPHESICAAVLAQIKIVPQESEYFRLGPVQRLFSIFIWHLDNMHSGIRSSTSLGLLMELDRVLQQHRKALKPPIGTEFEAMQKMIEERLSHSTSTPAMPQYNVRRRSST